ncbi:MAG: hypothetical protein AB2A00_30730 [Myxococcota bacterium]
MATTKLTRSGTSPAQPAPARTPSPAPARPSATTPESPSGNAPLADGHGPSSGAAADHARRISGEFVDGKAAPAASGTVSALNLRVRTARLENAGGATLDEATSGAKGVHDSLAGTAMLISAPSAVGTPEVVDNPGVSASVHSHGGSTTLNGPVTHRNGEPSVDSVSVDVSRAGGTATVSRTTNGHATSTSFYVDKSYVDISLAKTWGTPEGARRAGGSLGLTRDSVYVGMSGAATTLGGHTGRASVLGSASADRAAVDLGPYEGPDPRLKGTRHVEVRKSLGGGLAGALGVANAVIGIGGRLAVDKSTSVSYRTHLATPQAREVLLEGGGVVGFLRNKARALGLVKDPVSIPDLSSPQSLKPGDVLTVRTSGSVVAGAAVGVGALTAGVDVEMRGDFELSVQKLDDNKVELALVPVNLRGVQVFADTPYLLDIGHSRTRGEGLRQSFVFDLSNPAAAAAYQRALKGELPNGMKANAAPRDDGDLAALVRNEKLPTGVTRTMLERAEVRASATGAGLNWGLIQFGSSIAGLGFKNTRTEGHSVITDGGASVATETRGVERKREVLLSGTETHGITASSRTVTVYDDEGRPTREFAGLKLTARFSDDRVRGHELNDEVVDRINDAFGTHVAHFERKGRNQGREVSLDRVLDVSHLETLARVNLNTASNAARDAGAKEKPLHELLALLRQTRDPEARATSVKDYVADQGLAGFGALHRLLGGEINIDSSSTAYTRPGEKARTLSFKYENAVSPEDTADSFTERFTQVRKALADLSEARLDLRDDVFLTPEEKAALDKDLTHARATLERLVSVAHLSPAVRRRFHDDLDRGWTSSDEQALMAHLSAAGLG